MAFLIFVMVRVGSVVFFLLALACTVLTYLTFAYTHFPSDMIYGPIWTTVFWVAFAFCFVATRRSRSR
jgi:hypothetical protein